MTNVAGEPLIVDHKGKLGRVGVGPVAHAGVAHEGNAVSGAEDRVLIDAAVEAAGASVVQMISLADHFQRARVGVVALQTTRVNIVFAHDVPRVSNDPIRGGGKRTRASLLHKAHRCKARKGRGPMPHQQLRHHGAVGMPCYVDTFRVNGIGFLDHLQQVLEEEP